MVRRSLSASRLVTLTGVGGVGKTRLAVRVAEAETDRFPDGIGFIDLAPVAHPSLVVGTVLSELGQREQTSLPGADVITEHIRTRSNCWCWTTASM